MKTKKTTANYLLIRHKVNDFSKWKPGYDQDEPKRTAAGLTEVSLMRNKKSRNDLVILFAASSLPKARAFCARKDLALLMKQLGVIGKPELLVLVGA